MQAVAASELYVSAEHSPHAAALVAPVAAEYLPAKQLEMERGSARKNGGGGGRARWQGSVKKVN